VVRWWRCMALSGHVLSRRRREQPAAAPGIHAPEGSEPSRLFGIDLAQGASFIKAEKISGRHVPERPGQSPRNLDAGPAQPCSSLLIRDLLSSPAVRPESSDRLKLRARRDARSRSPMARVTACLVSVIDRHHNMPASRDSYTPEKPRSRCDNCVGGHRRRRAKSARTCCEHILAGLGRILGSSRPVLVGPPERRRSTRELLLVESLVMPLRGAAMRMHCPLAPLRSRDVVPSR
jgi:hypothetical protein